MKQTKPQKKAKPENTFVVGGDLKNAFSTWLPTLVRGSEKEMLPFNRVSQRLKGFSEQQ